MGAVTINSATLGCSDGGRIDVGDPTSGGPAENVARNCWRAGQGEIVKKNNDDDVEKL